MNTEPSKLRAPSDAQLKPRRGFRQFWADIENRKHIGPCARDIREQVVGLFWLAALGAGALGLLYLGHYLYVEISTVKIAPGWFFVLGLLILYKVSTRRDSDE